MRTSIKTLVAVATSALSLSVFAQSAPAPVSPAVPVNPTTVQGQPGQGQWHHNHDDNPAFQGLRQQIHADKEKLRADHEAAKAIHQQLQADRASHNEAQAQADHQRMQAAHATVKQDREKLHADFDQVRALKGQQGQH
jgi:Spy/CpxP family protein refolding chaperone